MQRRLLIIALIIAAVVFLRWTGEPAIVGRYLAERFGNAQEKTENDLVVWHPWGGPYKEPFDKLVREFEKSHPGVKVHPLYTMVNLGNNQKFFSSVSAGKPPDVMFVDGTQVAEFACQGALQPLEDRVKKAHIKGEDFFTPSWKQTNWRGHTWGLTYSADPNFAFAWNRKRFQEVGLDPNRPPCTIAELDKMGDKLSSRGPDGLRSIGIIPWSQYGPDNAVFTWGWVFGGEFFDEKHQKLTLNDPKNVKALEWMASYVKKYGVADIVGLSQIAFGSQERSPFYSGKVAMMCFYIYGVLDAKMYAPKVDYGLTYIPYPKGGERHSSWIGGWTLGLPRGSRRPDLGWEFIRWACTDPKGTMAVGKFQSLFPGYKKSPYFKTIEHDPHYGPFLEILKECRHQRPVMPAQAYCMGALTRAVDQVFYGRKTAKQALDDANNEVQNELNLRLAGN